MSGRAVGALFFLWTALGAALLFSLELLAARLMLPRFGSSASVWTTALVFFQGAVALGYAAAGFVLGRPGLALPYALLLGVAALPLAAPGLDAGGAPALRALGLLASTAGPVAVALGTTSIVAQGWWRGAGDRRSGQPWFLYGASNLGALLALLTYPTLIEPWVGLAAQRHIWGLLYLVFVLGGLALALGKRAQLPPQDLIARPPARLWLRWALWSAGANGLLVAVSLVVSQDAPAPLMWVPPLALYLLTWVLTFGREPLSARAQLYAGRVAVLVALVMLWLMQQGYTFQLGIGVLGNLALFVICLRVHGTLAAERPDPSQAGPFYLAVALGGLFGSALVGLAVPVLGAGLPSYGLDLAVAGGLLMAAWALGALAARRWWATAAAVACALWLGWGHPVGARSFYGIYKVDDMGSLRRFVHGNTVHGLQDRSRPEEPLAYYHRRSPVGRLFWRLGSELNDVAVVGLGVGVLTAYAQPGQRWSLFELDEAVVRLAREHFSYLADSAADTRDVTLGDGRLQLAAQPAASYDLLVLDTFSSDFVPTHLLTAEALAIYLERLKPGGLLVAHITGRIFDLAPVFADLCALAGASCVVGEGTALTEADRARGVLPNRWVALSLDPERIQALRAVGWLSLPEGQGGRAWTDDHVNLWQAVGWGGLLAR